ncbi:MAG: transporter substrate-binding domain-containing protein, partial [Clostridia bacterium]|nr:transporter substrate-binding domain-containing protein [Clostridia bacterium]
MKKILSIILSIIMLLSMGTVAFADGVNGPMQKAKLKVGISADFPPFEYYNENEELYGFDVDLMNYIGERIGFDIEFVNMSFDQLFSAVMGGEVACAISAISITEERNNVIDYTIPYLSAKVTHIDDETSDTSIEQYAIVFPNNSAEKGKLTE